MLANNVKGLRKEKELSLKKLGDLVDMDSTIIYYIENGKTKSARIDVVCKLAKAFKISLNELVYYEKIEFNNKLIDEIRLNENIKILRKRKGLTTIELGELVGINSGNINCIESGKTKYPRINLVCEISRALEVSLDELVYGEFE